MNRLLRRSADLEAAFHEILALSPFEPSTRLVLCHTLCSVAFEHAESAKRLLAHQNFTSAVGLFRLQYEALVRAMWLLYAATDAVVDKLSADLTSEGAKMAEKIPMLSEMLKKLEGKAPSEAVSQLQEFKHYSWKPLSSFVHGGIHAISRHGKGYPVQLLEQALKASNGVSMMVGMLVVILSGDPNQQGRLPSLQRQFADCLPPERASRS